MGNTGKEIVQKIRGEFGTVKHYCDRQNPPFPVKSFYKFLRGDWGSRAGSTRSGAASGRYHTALLKDNILDETTGVGR